MELLILIGILSLYFVGFCMMVCAFLLSQRFPSSLWLIRSGAYLAVAASLLFVVIPGAVPWWDYDAWSYWTRLLAVVLPGAITFVLLRRDFLGQKNKM